MCIYSLSKYVLCIHSPAVVGATDKLEIMGTSVVPNLETGQLL